MCCLEISIAFDSLKNSKERFIWVATGFYKISKKQTVIPKSYIIYAWFSFYIVIAEA